MNFFHYKNNSLYAEDISVQRITDKVGTPLYIYSYETVKRRLSAYQNAFKNCSHIICYALKANSNAAVLRIISSLEGGADIVSGGELYRSLKAGISAKKTVFAGVGKKDEEIRYALSSQILLFNVESFEELSAINEIAGAMKVKAPVALRVNPDIDPQTHPYISTGLKENKFGIPVDDAFNYYLMAKRLPHINVLGIHNHIGSQITKLSLFVDAFKKIIALYDKLKDQGFDIQYIDMGGGLGISYQDEEPPAPEELAGEIVPLINGRAITLLLEPGRSIVGDAGILVTKVLYRKKSGEKEFIIVDAGMNDVLRPSLYNAFHHLQSIVNKQGETIVADIVGPICESGDFIAKNRKITRPKRGELLAVMNTGAYGFSMASNYNSRPRVAEIMVKGKDFFIINERETYADLIKNEKIPKFL